MSKTLLALLLPVALAACAAGTPEGDAAAIDDTAATGDASAAGDIAATLPRYHWRLQDAKAADGSRIDALFARADKPLTLDFADGHIGVSNACNRMAGRYALAGDTMTMKRMGSTLMACPDPRVMALDGEIGDRLKGSLRIALQPGPAPRLMLTTAEGDVLTFEGDPTAETRYGSAGETVFLEIAAQTEPCPHPFIPDKQCLQARELQYDARGRRQGTPGAFQHFHGEIEGYTHEPGIRNVLRVERYPIRNPPADAPDTAYVLGMVVESENMRP